MLDTEPGTLLAIFSVIKWLNTYEILRTVLYIASAQ